MQTYFEGCKNLVYHVTPATHTWGQLVTKRIIVHVANFKSPAVVVPEIFYTHTRLTALFPGLPR